MISIRHLAKVYGETRVLRDVSCDIEQGEVVSVIGPSGTGKSTMLRCINLLERPTSGQIVVDGQDVCGDDVDVTALRLKVGMVFQSFNLFSHLTVIENLMMAPCDLLGMGRTDAYRRAMQLLSQVGLPDRRLAYPDELSGGQRQRVAIARTLMMDPDTILFDEPTSALDPTMVGEVKAVIRDLAHTRKTLIIVTHELEFARSISSRVLYLDQGVVYEQGSPEEIFERPRRERTRQFVMRLKVLELRLEGPPHRPAGRLRGHRGVLHQEPGAQGPAGPYGARLRRAVRGDAPHKGQGPAHCRDLRVRRAPAVCHHGRALQRGARGRVRGRRRGRPRLPRPLDGCQRAPRGGL